MKKTIGWLANEIKRHGLYAVPKTFNPLIWSRFCFLQGRKIFVNTILPKKMAKSLRRRYRKKNVDAYLISFPKCGRTWLAMLIGKAIQELYPMIPERKIINLHDLHFYHKNIPYIFKMHDGTKEVLDSPHKVGFEKRLQKYSDYKVIYLVRNPLDVFVSYYYQKVYREQDYHGTLQDFIDKPEKGIDLIIDCYNLWGRLANELLNIKIIRYEELHENTSGVLKDTLNFVGIKNCPENILNTAVEFASFENMRNMEENNFFLTDTLQPAQKKHKNSYKTRRGEVGGNKKELTENQHDKLLKRVKERLQFFY